MSIYGQMAQIGSSGGGAIEREVFGDGSDGVGLFTSNTTWNAPTEDTGMIIKQFKSLTIAQGVTVSAGNRNCGMIVRVQGNCTINGTLENRMSPKTLRDVDNVDFSMWPLTMLSLVGGTGGTGGKGAGTAGGGNGGTGMIGRFYGGGYGGGGGGSADQKNTSSHRGKDGSSSSLIDTSIADIFIGGTWSTPALYGGGGAGYESGAQNGPSANGLETPSSQGAGSGGGNGAYGGGVLILLVGGSLTISNTGKLDCSGAKGGNGGKCSSGGASGAGGGGGGGGIIFICYKQSYNNTGNILVNGGAGGAPIGGYNINYSSYPQCFGGVGSDGITSVKTFDQYKEEDVL